MTDIKLEELMKLVEMKRTHPEEYQKFLQNIKEVYKDMIKIMKEL